MHVSLTTHTYRTHMSVKRKSHTLGAYKAFTFNYRLKIEGNIYTKMTTNTTIIYGSLLPFLLDLPQRL